MLAACFVASDIAIYFVEICAIQVKFEKVSFYF